jgi:hypothetical protein
MTDDSSHVDSVLRNGWGAVELTRTWLAGREPLSEPDDDRIQHEADIEDALELAVAALRRAEGSRTQEDVSEAAAAVSQLATLLEI